MTDHKCIIGGYYVGAYECLVTLDGLINEIEKIKRFNLSMEENAKKIESTYPEGAERLRKMADREYTMDDFCDFRKKVPMVRFSFCPICGKKIDWKALRDAV